MVMAINSPYYYPMDLRTQWNMYKATTGMESPEREAAMSKAQVAAMYESQSRRAALAQQNEQFNKTLGLQERGLGLQERGLGIQERSAEDAAAAAKMAGYAQIGGLGLQGAALYGMQQGWFGGSKPAVVAPATAAPIASSAPVWMGAGTTPAGISSPAMVGLGGQTQATGGYTAIMGGGGEAGGAVVNMQAPATGAAASTWGWNAGTATTAGGWGAAGGAVGAWAGREYGQNLPYTGGKRERSAMGGAIGGFIAGGLATSWSGPGMIIGGLVGAIIGVIAGGK